jgi:hypothetical protein
VAGMAEDQTDKSFLVLFFKKEQALLFKKRSKNFLFVLSGVAADREPGCPRLPAALGFCPVCCREPLP